MKIHSKTTLLLPWRRPFFFLVFILQLVACSLWGQVLQKKNLTINDYPKWGELSLNKMSANGQWICYSMTYENRLDTLFVKNTKSLLTKAFPLGNNGDFITSDWFTYQTAQELHLLNLKTGKQETVDNAIQYVYAPKAKKLLILKTEKDKENVLIIRDLDGMIQERIERVNTFVMDPTNQIVLYTTTIGKQHIINLLQLSQENKKTTLFSGSSSFSNLTWDEKGKSLAFMQKYPDESSFNNTIFYYNVSNKKLYTTSSQAQNSFLGDSLCMPSNILGYMFKLKISDDMRSVFFNVQQKIKSKDTIRDTAVQLWNGNAKLIYPMQEKQKNNKRTYLALWRPLENQFQLISNDILPKYMLTGDQKYAILSNEEQYEPQYSKQGPRDFYLMDVSTGKSELLLKKQSGSLDHTTASPNGRYIAYFQQKDWWIYDVTKKIHINITKNIGVSFSNNQKGHPQKNNAYSPLGWTQEDKEILLYDAYDIWAIRPDGSSARRLTHGRESQTQFRLAGSTYVLPAKVNYDGMIFYTHNLDTGLLLETTSEQGYYGFYKCSSKSNEKLVFSTNSRLDQLIQSDRGNVFIYTEQRYDLSPRLMLQSHTDKIPKVLLLQSNPQQQQFYWGKSELIQYKNSKGKSLQGILYYPANYNNQKKYPMIVYIYEKLSKKLHNKYLNPSQFIGEDEAFNSTSFTTQGYFVLAPDIIYEIGNVGVSAVDCVVSATNEVIAQGHVLPNKIGLIGHSFGGYETDFIITQTNLFAAAAAGAAATDLTSFYLTVGRTGRDDIWRFENHQWRMGKSLFEDKEGYDRNSPIVHAKNITTPLLSWTGGKDKQVNWNQSIEFYLALRRLEKKHIMLLYPKEEHTISNSENQKDLSNRVHEWFDYHLKDMQPSSWIKSGLK
ncbi:prolyl oligopeptidase family serine peptidase [Flavobacterium sp. F-65]|uniref:Prolyl oligopeptidase family serine peptidase n=1 Tax=Flavobacterium pisciphilum TaxID=2893755 RepID=A0ABS8MXM5_9FLAO|nr:prolyl oligopeptidase family serine peptidase [Flavobacterium sp. F-65]MCC9073531.1 prolyl oligopeptidase family serine peptidase [Flavobacterium sp. F-65]